MSRKPPPDFGPPDAVFLERLKHYARLVGWDVDFAESWQFVVRCYRLAGLPEPPPSEADPYPVEDD